MRTRWFRRPRWPSSCARPPAQPARPAEDRVRGSAGAARQEPGLCGRRRTSLHAPGLGAKEGHPSFGNAASAFLQSRDARTRRRTSYGGPCQDLNQTGGSDERCSRRGRRRRRRFPRHALGERAGIRRRKAWDYLADGDDGRLVLLLRLAGVSRDLQRACLRFSVISSGSRDLGAEIARFDAHDQAEVRRRASGCSSIRLSRRTRGRWEDGGGDSAL